MHTQGLSDSIFLSLLQSSFNFCHTCRYVVGVWYWDIVELLRKVRDDVDSPGLLLQNSMGDVMLVWTQVFFIGLLPFIAEQRNVQLAIGFLLTSAFLLVTEHPSSMTSSIIGVFTFHGVGTHALLGLGTDIQRGCGHC